MTPCVRSTIKIQCFAPADVYLLVHINFVLPKNYVIPCQLYYNSGEFVFACRGSETVLPNLTGAQSLKIPAHATVTVTFFGFNIRIYRDAR